MKRYSVEYLPLFYEALRNIEEYMADHGRSDPSIDRFQSTVFDTCEKFATFPNRGTKHDDVMEGLRVTNIDGDTILAFVVDDDALTVTFVDISYGGQNWMEMFSLPGSSRQTSRH